MMHLPWSVRFNWPGRFKTLQDCIEIAPFDLQQIQIVAFFPQSWCRGATPTPEPGCPPQYNEINSKSFHVMNGHRGYIFNSRRLQKISLHSVLLFYFWVLFWGFFLKMRYFCTQKVNCNWCPRWVKNAIRNPFQIKQLTQMLLTRGIYYIFRIKKKNQYNMNGAERIW